MCHEGKTERGKGGATPRRAFHPEQIGLTREGGAGGKKEEEKNGRGAVQRARIIKGQTRKRPKRRRQKGGDDQKDIYLAFSHMAIELTTHDLQEIIVFEHHLTAQISCNHETYSIS